VKSKTLGGAKKTSEEKCENMKKTIEQPLGPQMSQTWQTEAAPGDEQKAN
jgi:hypothetical protein